MKKDVELTYRKILTNKSNIDNLIYYKQQITEAKQIADAIKKKYDDFENCYKANQINCVNHLPVVLGGLSKAIVLDKDGNKMPVMYRKCLLCGYNMCYDCNEYEIDATNYLPELNDSYPHLDLKYNKILNEYLEFCRNYGNSSNIDEEFKIYIENDGFVNRKTSAKKRIKVEK